MPAAPGRSPRSRGSRSRPSRFGVVFGCFGAVPPGNWLDLGCGGDRELAQGHRRLGIGGLGRLAQPAVGPGLRDGIAVVRGGADLDRDRILPAGDGQLLAEQGIIAVADVSGHHRPGTDGRAGQVQDAQPPCPVISSIMSSASRHFSGAAPRPGSGPLAAAPRGSGHRIGQRLVISANRAEQPPVRGARGVLVHQVHAHRDLAIRGLAQRPEYCRATHGDAFPSLGKPVSSTTSASTGWRRRTTAPRTAARRRNPRPRTR